MEETIDLLIFWAVVATRFLVPLAIPRYPLPAIVAALILDMIDQTIFQQFTNLPLTGYQGYDKALDIYYLSIAYVSTMRNWTNHPAFKLDRFLFFFRLAGVALFELTKIRPLLLIFPNTFEYFFIFYEAVRLRWSPAQLTKIWLIAAAAFIWIFIKLPQEYWIHIARMDTTDWIRANPIGIVILAAWAAVMIIAAWLFLRRLSPADRRPSLAADPIPAALNDKIMAVGAREPSTRFINSELIEKTSLISLQTIIFAQVLPGVEATSIQIAAAVAFVIIINTALSHWLARRGTGWSSIIREFVVMSAVNFGIVLLYVFFAPRFLEATINMKDTSFFVLLLTLNVTLYDRYRQVYLLRFGKGDK